MLEGDSTAKFYENMTEVPQGSVLEPLLYRIFTSDLQQNPNIMIAIYADDIAFLASHDKKNKYCFEIYIG